MDKTKIDWCDSTWNPVTGCFHECEYCYARGMASRFGGASETHCNETVGTECQWETSAEGKIHVLSEPIYDYDHGRNAPYPYEFDPTFHKYRLNEYQNKKGRNIFVCSMADLFGDWVPDEWIEEVFKACHDATQHNYLFLTKNPQRYYDLAFKKKLPQEKNFWYGTTITGPEQRFFCIRGINTFLSIEPILEPFPVGIVNWPAVPGWIIVGSMTGPGSKRHQPQREWIESINRICEEAGVPLFMKDSLKPIWGPDLIQMYPDGMPSWTPGHKAIPHCKACLCRIEYHEGKRGTSIFCKAMGDKHVGARYARTSPPWCPKREDITDFD